MQSNRRPIASDDERVLGWRTVSGLKAGFSPPSWDEPAVQAKSRRSAADLPKKWCFFVSTPGAIGACCGVWASKEALVASAASSSHRAPHLHQPQATPSSQPSSTSLHYTGKTLSLNKKAALDVRIQTGSATLSSLLLLGATVASIVHLLHLCWIYLIEPRDTCRVCPSEPQTSKASKHLNEKSSIHLRNRATS